MEIRILIAKLLVCAGVACTCCVGFSAQTYAATCPSGPDWARCNLELSKQTELSKRQQELNKTLETCKQWNGDCSSVAQELNSVNEQMNKSSDITAPDANGAKSSASSNSDLPDIATANFKLNPKDFSPSKKTYNSGTGNITTMIGDIVRIMLISISTLAVLCIAIGGAMMSVSGGNSDRVSKGKAIVTHSIQAIGLSLSAYLIIQFVSWVIA